MPKFIVTKRAGKEVAGLPNPGPGKAIELTEMQAQHPLRIGHIERQKAVAPAPSAKPKD